MLSQMQVLNPSTTRRADGDQPVMGAGLNGEMLASEIHGKFYTINKRGGLFTANVTAVTVPVVAATMVSVFSLYNPRNSGVDMELVDLDITSVLATLVVNTFGLYYSAGKNADTATFTTKVAPQHGRVGENPGNKGEFYSALTHVGTPVRWRILGGHHATTSTAAGGIHVDFDGKAIIPPGVAVSLAASTAAGTTSGLDVGVSWAEWPV